MIKKKRRKNPLNPYISLDLINGFLCSDIEKLITNTMFFKQGDWCKDCESSIVNCYCDYCENCEYQKCICKLVSDYVCDPDLVSKHIWKLAKENLNDTELTELAENIYRTFNSNKLYKKSEIITPYKNKVMDAVAWFYNSDESEENEKKYIKMLRRL